MIFHNVPKTSRYAVSDTDVGDEAREDEAFLGIRPRRVTTPLPGSHGPSDPTEADVLSRTRGDWLLRVGSALFYGVSSFLITVVNKVVLTSYAFPSYLVVAIGQMAATVVLLLVARKCGLVTFPPLEMAVVRKTWPLPVFYLGNLVFGLGGTKELSIPMQVVLRRFSVLMTMFAEFYWLRVHQSRTVKVAVYTMIAGSAVAAADDFTFSVRGYAMVFVNNLFTAGSGIVIKQKLAANELGAFGLLFYNSLLMLPPCALAAWLGGDLREAWLSPAWLDPAFLVYFAASCAMGCVLTYSTLVCTQLNSALTTTVVGCLKSICTTYAGMLVGGDYVFSVGNFVGINISVVGSLAYSWVTFRHK